jgi:hypothetical protein
MPAATTPSLTRESLLAQQPSKQETRHKTFHFTLRMGRSAHNEVPKKKKSSSKRPLEHEDELPEDDPDAEAAGARRKEKKAQKKSKPVEPEPEDNEETDGEEEGGDAEEGAAGSARKLALRMRKKRHARKASGYKSKAEEAGWRKELVSGKDCFASCISAADAKRMMRFAPQNVNKGSFDTAEGNLRMQLSQESVPDSAARVTQARTEAVFRHIMNAAVLRTVERKVATVDASTMVSVLRPYVAALEFTGTLPKGVIRYAQSLSLLGVNAEDEQLVEAEKAENKELSSTVRKMDSAEKARKAAFSARKLELQKRRDAAKA